MPITPTYPGVYIEEVSSGVHTISGVATSITAFVGAASRGLENQAVRLFSFADYERAFGGLASDSEMSYAVQQFFDNGGSDAYVVRVTKASAAAAQIVLLAGAAGTQAVTLTARSKGTWGNNVVADVDYNGILPADTKAFNLTLTDLGSGRVETFPKVTVEAGKANNVVTVVNDPDSGSQLVAATIPDATAGRPLATGTSGTDITAALDPTKAYGLKVSIDADGAVVASQAVAILAVNETRPDKVQGLCLLLERKVNPVLDGLFRGLTISCQPTSNGKGIRVRALYPPDRYPQATDAVITFAAPATGEDAALALGLSGATVAANVARYWLGKGRTGKGAQSGPVPGDGGGLPGTGELIGS